ncbi:MAG: DUF2065 domain-containing protein [Paracoccaceae bacterium]
MAWIILALGLVLIVEGLAYALAPSLIEEILQLLRDLPLETRRLMGLLSMVMGVLLAWGGYALMQASNGGAAPF